MHPPRPNHPAHGFYQRLFALLGSLLLACAITAPAGAKIGENNSEQAAMELAGEIVAVLSSDAAPYAAAAEGLRKGLAGVDTVRAVPLASADVNALAASGARLVAIGGPAAARFLKDLPATSDFYYCMISDPAAIGLTADQRSRGITTEVPIEAQVRLMKSAAPHAKRIGALHDSRNAGSLASATALRAALEPEYELVLVDVSRHTSVAAALDALLATKVDLIWTSADSAVYDAAVLRAVLLAGVRANVPVLGFSAPMVKAGALVGTGIDPRDQGEDLAAIIIAGPSKTPVGPQPPRVRIAVNTLVAEKLSRPLPRSLVNTADHVYPEGGK